MANLKSIPSPDSELRQIVRRIVRTYDPDKIVLFGSYAYGAPGPDSDFDLLIIKNSAARPIDRRIEVMMAIQPVLNRTPVGPLVLTADELAHRLKIGDQFFCEIMEKGKVLYERRSVTRSRRMVRNRRTRSGRVQSPAQG